uniref:Uncharacterized protein n=1 Tax=viral metagenome TaxID=1070528 RepID=A0A6M3KAG8_9ZZZZ
MPEETSATCETCGGGGYIGDELCSSCYGGGVLPTTGVLQHIAKEAALAREKATELEGKVDDLMDRCNDIMDKCNDIFEKVSE